MELREALSHIAEIRARVAATERFRGYRALPVATSGLLALLATVAQPLLVPNPSVDLAGYLAVWLTAAVVGAAAAGSGIWLRHRTTHLPLSREVTRLAVSQFAPCLVAGGLVTLVIARHAPQVGWMLPGLWQVLFSLGVFASYRLLPPPTVGIGIFYLIAGVVNLANSSTNTAFSPWAMGLPFSIGQLATAAILYWHLERDHAE